MFLVPKENVQRALSQNYQTTRFLLITIKSNNILNIFML